MITKELAKKIRVLQITTRKVVNDVLAGEYGSVFRGRGMEFDEVREYMPGDEIRSIDWNVTARTGHPYVKRFVEERELTVMFLVDLSSSGAFGSVRKLKNEIAAELCALLAFSAVKNNDKVGMIVFTDRAAEFQTATGEHRYRGRPRLPGTGYDKAFGRLPRERFPGRRIREENAGARKAARSHCRHDCGSA